jgi:hypothetical protein
MCALGTTATRRPARRALGVAVSVAGYELDGAARGVVVQPDEVCHLGGGAGDWEPVRGPVARPVCGPVVLRTSGAGRATNICPRRQ